MKKIFNLPFLSSYPLRKINPLSSHKVKIFLGNTFYARINNIYNNICTAIVQNNWEYLQRSLQPDLYTQITTELSAMKQNNFKIKLTTPNKVIQRKRKSFKMVENQWIGDFTKIAVECKVLFGEEFSESAKDGQQERKIIRIGSSKYFSYRSKLTFLENIKRFYNFQIYQFRVRIKSTIFLQIVGREGELINQQTQKQITSQIKLKTSHQNFNWVITAINNFGSSL